MFACRPVTDGDAALLLHLARSCPPLDVHTGYTYWVICHLYRETAFVLEEGGRPVGYVMAVPHGRVLFVWQVGIQEEYRGLGLAGRLFDALAMASRGRFDLLELTISPDNAASLGAFNSWCRNAGLLVDAVGPIRVPEHEEPGEILYRVNLQTGGQETRA